MKIPLTILLSVALIATSSSAIIARMLPDIHPVVIAFWRVVIAGAFLWLYSGFVPQGPIKPEKRGTVVFAGMLLGIHFACFFQALKLTTIANATLFCALPPIFTALAEKFILKRAWNRNIIWGLAIAFSGLAIVFSNQLNLGDNHKAGIYFAILASVIISAVWLLSEHIRKLTKSVVYTRSLFLSASLPLILLALVNNQNIFNVGCVDIAWLTALGILPTVLGHGLYYHVIKYIRPTVVASVQLGEPVVAVIFAFIIFSEPVTAVWILGGTITLSGLVLITSNQ